MSRRKSPHLISFCNTFTTCASLSSMTDSVRSTSRTATSIGRRRCSRRRYDRLRNWMPAIGAGARPGIATSTTDGTCVVRPSAAAAATPAGPEPSPAISKAVCNGVGRVVPSIEINPYPWEAKVQAVSPSPNSLDRGDCGRLVVQIRRAGNQTVGQVRT